MYDRVDTLPFSSNTSLWNEHIFALMDFQQEFFNKAKLLFYKFSTIGMDVYIKQKNNSIV